MKLWLLLAVLAALLVYFPGLLATVLGVAGTVLVAAAQLPTVWAFAAGLLAAPHVARRWAR